MVGGGACSTHFRDLKSSQMLPTHHSRSTSPPCLAMADFTLLANWTASSSACEKEGRAVLSAGSGHRGRAGLARGGTHLSGHGGQVPDAADDGPAGHHPQQVRHHPILAAVPEGVPELRVVLQDSGKLGPERSVAATAGGRPQQGL